MRELNRAWLASNPLPWPEGETDKNKRGRTFVAGGSEAVPGAMLLTGEAALRAGAGKVQIATVERAALALGIQMPEAATFGLPVNVYGELAGDAGAVLVDLIESCDALVLGPGMGPEAGAENILSALIARPPKDSSLLLDAAMIPAARVLEKHSDAWKTRRVMTPHFGEMAALMECDELDVSPELAQSAAARFGATVILKASETWIASPGEAMLHYAGGGPGLATAGSGDVLAGIIGGLLARGASPTQAGAWGVWLHGEAGKQLAQRSGTLGFLARELSPIVPSLC